MLNAFLQFFDNHGIKYNDKKFLLACSGGKDSMCLVDLMLKAGLDFAIAHVNHGTRSGDSDLDAMFVEAYAKKNNLTFYLHNIDLAKLKSGSNESVQMIARNERYSFLRKLKKDYLYDYIATAHHRDDIIETFFINLSRSGGLQALSSIPVLTDEFIRPLAYLSQAKILNYIEENNVQHRHDISNDKTVYKRNVLRNNVLPVLQSWEPGIKKSTAKSIQFLKESEEFIQAEIRFWKQKNVQYSDQSLRIDRGALEAHHSPVYILHGILIEYGFNHSQCRDLIKEPRTGKKIQNEEFVVRMERNELVLLKRVSQETKVLPVKSGQYIDGLGVLSIETNDKVQANLKLRLPLRMLDKDLVFRRRNHGDVFSPKGMKGRSKKLKKYFVDEKYSTDEKDKQWLLCKNNKILWVVGKREAELEDSDHNVYLTIKKK